MKIQFLLLMCFLVSCAHQDNRLGTSLDASSTASSSPSFSTPMELEEESLVESTPLVVIADQSPRSATKEELERTMQVAQFTEYDQNLKKTEVFFGTYEKAGLNPEKSFYEFSPSIIIKRNKKPAEFISWPELAKYGWVSAAQLPDKGHYWGFLDYQVEGRINEVMIIGSQDSGMTWTQYGSLKKNYFTDEFYAFTMGEDGHGTATIQRFGEGEDESKGFDIFTTKDFGKTWSEPVFHKSDVNFVNEFAEECSFSLKPTKKLPKECQIPLEMTK